MTDGIGLQESPQLRRIHPRLVVVEIERPEELLAGVAEAHAGALVWLAEGAVGEGAGALAFGVRGGDDRA